MIIKHKFDLGEQVFTIKENKIQTCRILTVTMRLAVNEIPVIQYTIGINLSFATTTYSVEENELFKTKQELIQSL
jgi:hypothetical protein